MTGAQVLHLLRRGAVVLAALLVVAMLYGTFVEPRLVLDVRRSTVPIPELPEDLTGTTIAVVSDLQVGMWLANVGMIERAVGRRSQVIPEVRPLWQRPAWSQMVDGLGPEGTGAVTDRGGRR